MRTHTPAGRIARRAALLLLPLWAVAVSACNLQFSTGVEAKDTWSRTYKVNADATLELKAANGKIRISAIDGDEIQVAATRVAKGSTDEAAKAALDDVKITESATADWVSLSSGGEGLQLNLRGHRVDYDVKVPRTLQVAIKSVNGEIEIEGVGGFVTIESTNGRVTATGLADGADINLVNGEVKADFASVGGRGLRCKTTNGEIIVTVPTNAKATLAARVANGAIQTENLTVQATEESRRRLDATIGGGGPELRVETINGEITIRGRREADTVKK